MTIGSYDPSLERIQLMSYSHPYMQHAYIFAYSKSKKNSTPSTRLLAPFQYIVWISIAIILIASTLVILLSKKLSTRQRHFVIGGHVNRTPITNMLNVMIGNAVSNPKMKLRKYFGVFARTLFILWLFFWLIVRSSYQGSLYKYLQNQVLRSPYDTVEKVYLSGAEINVIQSAADLVPSIFKEDR